MRILILVIVIAILAAPGSGICYPVKNADKCVKFRDKSKEINGVIGSIIMGERPFLTFIMEDGDELVMLPENDKALRFFRENAGKHIRASYHLGDILWTDDFSDNGPGNCEDAFYFEGGRLIK